MARSCRQSLWSILVTTLAIVGSVNATPPQESTPSPAASPAATASPSATSTPVPSPIPLAEVITQAETVQGILRDINGDLAADRITATVESELPTLANDIEARINEDTQILNSRPSLETLRTRESKWTTLGEQLPFWRRELSARATLLDREIARLGEIGARWQQTLNLAHANIAPDAAEQEGAPPTGTEAVTGTPPEIVRRVEATIAAIRRTRTDVEGRRGQVLSLQNSVAEQSARLSQALENVRLARTATVNRLFVKDSPPIWSAEVRSRAGQNLLQDSQNTFATQWDSLKAYARTHWANFVVHMVVLLLLVAALYWANRRVQPWLKAEPSLKSVLRVFNMPVATALVLSILASGWIYPQAPRLLSAVLGGAALVPTIIILRQLVEDHLFPVLNALVVFYFIDQLLALSAVLAVFSRLLFLLEMLGGFLFVVWLIKSARLARVPEAERDRLWKIVNFGGRLAGAVFLLAAVLNALGYVSLASLAGGALLSSAYVAVIFYAAIRIMDGLIMLASRVRPLAFLGMVNRHRPLFRRRMRSVLRWIATLGWILYTLEFLSLRAPIVENIRAALTAKLEVGSLHVSLGNVLAFLITVWAAFLLSRFLRFILDEDVYPRVHLARGIPYAVSTMLHYAILLVGFFFAVAAMGIDMTKFTILAGAFGVGLGFGLQNIVNNFVSGLILLFERPVNVGDTIQVGEWGGKLRRVGLRASVIRTLQGSEVIVPNGQLISQEVVNWTLSDQHRRVEIDVGVAYGTAPERVIKLLNKVATNHPDVMQEPPPETLFLTFGDSALNFQLRAWTSRFERWVQISSELTVGVNAALRDAGIAIPFPQRDVHIQNPNDVDKQTARNAKQARETRDREVPSEK